MLSIIAIAVSAAALSLNLLPALASTLKVDVDPKDGNDASLVFTSFGTGLIWGIKYRRIQNIQGMRKRDFPWSPLRTPLTNGQSTEIVPAWGSYHPPEKAREYRTIEARYWAFFIPRRTEVSSYSLIRLDRVREKNNLQPEIISMTSFHTPSES